MAIEVYRRQGRLFVQDDQDDPFWLLTCTGAGDVTLPAGDETPVYCPDPASVGDFVITGAIVGEAGFVTYSMDRPLQSTLNYLITHLHDCTFHGQVVWSIDGSVPDVWTDYLLSLHLHRSRVSSRTIGQPAIIAPDNDERVDTTADLNAYVAWLYYPSTASRIAVAETEAINGIDFDLSKECSTEEIGGDLIGKEGYFTSDHTSTSPAVSADVWYTLDYGATWNLCATDPFDAAEDAGPVVTRGGRVIVGRVDTDALNPAEVGISDDYGTTWANVDVGALDGQVINALWWQDWTHLWAACSSGYVYFSEDAGQTWTAQSSGAPTAQHLMDICAYDTENVWAVGAAGAIIRTADGVNWALATGPAGIADQFNAVFMLNSTRVLIGSNAGVVYRTNDGGATAANWTTLTTPQWSGGEVRAIRGDMAQRYTIYIAGDTSGPVGEVYRSRDGAASFQEIVDVVTNNGLNDLAIIDHNNAFAAGEAVGGTGFLVKMFPTS